MGLEKINILRKQKGISLDALVSLSGVPKGTLSKISAGITKNPSLDTMTAIANALGCSIDDFHDNISPIKKDYSTIPGALPIARHSLPILGGIHCGEPQFAEQEFEYYTYAGAEINADFILRANGDSMVGARIYDGDLIFIRSQPDVENGQIAAVLIDDATTLKRVYKLQDGRCELRAENPKYAPIMVGGMDETRTIKILGRAVALQSDIV